MGTSVRISECICEAEARERGPVWVTQSVWHKWHCYKPFRFLRNLKLPNLTLCIYRCRNLVQGGSETCLISGPGKWITCLCFTFLSEPGVLHLSDKEHCQEGLDCGILEDPEILSVKNLETRISTGYKMIPMFPKETQWQTESEMHMNKITDLCI